MHLSRGRNDSPPQDRPDLIENTLSNLQLMTISNDDPLSIQDRPDLIESELSGLAFDSNQQIFKTAHIELMFNQTPPTPVLNEAVYIFIDPAAGGPQSDYAVLTVTRQKGLLTVILVIFSTSCTDRPA